MLFFCLAAGLQFRFNVLGVAWRWDMQTGSQGVASLIFRLGNYRTSAALCFSLPFSKALSPAARLYEVKGWMEWMKVFWISCRVWKKKSKRVAKQSQGKRMGNGFLAKNELRSMNENTLLQADMSPILKHESSTPHILSSHMEI